MTLERVGDFLPGNYTPPKGGGNYMKFVQGVNTFRFLSKPIMGMEYWKTIVGQDGTETRKPVRVRPGEDISISEIGDQPPKHFWAMIVWNYNDRQVQILEITQRTIIDTITSLARNPKWGSPLGYDLVVTREGERKETKYNVTPDPKEELSEEVQKALESTTINLEALYDGGDPFAKKAQQNEEQSEQSDEINVDDVPFG
ncbi:MAG: hypothetical protein QME66_04295 [Candidatus Eisenbacteria bacterium]|nr:hypothetical protein [Candidatus Eisenbacteria bacterium]